MHQAHPADPPLATPQRQPQERRKRSEKFKRSHHGCDWCRHKRKKCDEAKPSCSGCVRVRRPCHYSQGFKHRHTKATGAPQQQSSPAMALSPPVFLKTSTLAMRLFQDNHPSIRHASGTARLPGPLVAFSLLDKAEDGSALGFMAEAYSVLILSMMHNDCTLRQEAWRAYTKAMQQMSPLLQTDVCSHSIEPLCTALLMAYFESTAAFRAFRSPNYLKQVNGIKALMEALSPAVVRAKEWSKLLQICRWIVLCFSIHSETFPLALLISESAVWQSDNFQLESTVDDEFETLYTDLARLKGKLTLLQAVDERCTGSFGEYEFAKRIYNQASLFFWRCQAWDAVADQKYPVCTTTLPNQTKGHWSKTTRWSTSAFASIQRMKMQNMKIAALEVAAECAHITSNWDPSFSALHHKRHGAVHAHQQLVAVEYLASMIPSLTGDISTPSSASTPLSDSDDDTVSWPTVSLTDLSVTHFRCLQTALRGAIRIRNLDSGLREWFQEKLASIGAVEYAQFTTVGA